MTRAISVSDDTRSRQARAADPKASIWVEANAGSGKTHVLVDRVLRLLLSGVKPEEILCLTYTKAAAAEMRRRVSARLADWALRDSAALDEALQDLEQRPSSAALRHRARTLFAHALETPGGLKIVTIHAFCESILHRFPLEAGVPFDFTVIEEDEKTRMVIEAREAVLAGGLNGDTRLADAVATLFALLSDTQITTAIEIALADARKLRPVLADRDGAKARLRGFSFYTGETSAALHDEMLAGRLLGPVEIAAMLAIVAPKSHGTRFEDKLARLDADHPMPQHLLKTFLTGEHEVPKGFPGKALALADPGLAALCLAEARRLEDLAGRLRHATLIERSEALLDVLCAISDRFEAKKRARSLLDFDDLIARVHALFDNPALGPWVQYKLDAGITHILVDESQDTNPEQWAAVKAIAREFFVGDSAAERQRTLFAVGDEKQSIYSFQGADPRLFGESGREFAVQADRVGKAFARVPLHTSFRTLPGILAAVDKVFARTDIRTAVLAPADAPVHHDTARTDPGGFVTLWPEVKQEGDDADADDWPLEPPKAQKIAQRQLAEHIAGEIRRWIVEQRPLGPRGRPVSASDVLILIQSRSTMFLEIIRALLKFNLPTAGADQLAVTTHIAVLDLLALGDVLLNPADDLQLAAVLRSPLFDVGEDELLALAHGRHGRLWDALARSVRPAAASAFERLHRWRGRLDFERPFEFFAEILYAEQGLKRFHSRLGSEVDDVFAEFLRMALDHERTEQASLQGFLVAVRARDLLVKRELPESGSGVRVMTVHGAKGLESPIVILADAATKPTATQTSKPVYVVKDAPGPMLVHASRSKDHVPETLRLRQADEANQRDEYWRKLYVGMTRAEDELYVAGVLTKTGNLEKSWYEAIGDAVRDESEIVRDGDGKLQATIFPMHRPAARPVAATARQSPVPLMPLIVPALPAYRPRHTVRPSSAFEPAEAERVFDTALESAIDAEAARREGLALHALLQHLGRVARHNWQRVVDKAMPTLLPEAPERHPDLAAKAMTILDNPAFAHLFGATSRAELPFLANARRNGAPIRLAGRIDRLVVDDHRVLVVDYKSDAAAPRLAADVPGVYLTQLGLYALVAGQLFPGKEVLAGILWTTLESLMILPREDLAGATRGFTME